MALLLRMLSLVCVLAVVFAAPTANQQRKFGLDIGLSFLPILSLSMIIYYRIEGI